ncbi:MAG: molybdate ABC transporter permease subunit [Gemmatimonadetes bacterium]|nr:molybdate ABC transporter permease subunit [Gemmatimonadota bacterium]
MNPGPPKLRRLLPLGIALAMAAVATVPGWSQLRPDVGGEGRDLAPILVLAASSLTDVLPRLAQSFEADGGPVVRYSFDATSRLAVQIEAGAPADVIVSADAVWMEWLADRGLLAGSPVDVASNELVVVVPAGRSALLRSPADLEGVGTLAVGGENVPAGRYARQALAAAGVWDDVREAVVTAGSARGVLEWVARGEVDAGIVYRTDALAEPAVVTAFTFPPGASPHVRYQAAVLNTSDRRDAGAGFLAYFSSPEAMATLRSAGFDPGGEGPLTGEQVDGGAPGATLPSVASAIRLSLLVAFLATLAGLVPAVALGWLLARYDFPGKTLVSTLVLAPLVMPPVVTGFLLLTLLGRQGPLGSLLGSLGLSVPFTLLGATIAALVVGLPLYVLAARGAFEAVDPLYEELSWTLGEPPRRTFFRVSLPLALPGIAAGAVLAFARALGEFGATVVLAGNVEGGTRTIALAVYTLLEAPSGRETTWILVGASVALSLLALVGFEALNRRQRRRVREDHGR